MSATSTGSSANVVTGDLHRVRRGRKKAFTPTAAPEAERKPARVAVMLAHAHMIQRAIASGEIRDQADAARRLGLTRARLTQLLDLTFLAPDLQERVLLLSATSSFQPMSERVLRLASRSEMWAGQRMYGMWKCTSELGIVSFK